MVSPLDRDEELSRILRHRAVRAGHAGNNEAAQKALQEAGDDASGSRDNDPAEFVSRKPPEHYWPGRRNGRRPSHIFEEDRDDPFSMQLLSRAYHAAGDSVKMHEVEARLRGTNVPTIEQAVVVPEQRAQRPSTL